MGAEEQGAGGGAQAHQRAHGRHEEKAGGVGYYIDVGVGSASRYNIPGLIVQTNWNV